MDKKFLGIGITAILTIVIIGVSSALPFNERNLERNDSLDLRVQIQDAMENRDYESWIDVMESRLTEEEFNKLLSVYEGRKERLVNSEGKIRGPWRDRERNEIKRYTQTNKLEMMPDCEIWKNRLE